MTDKEKIKEEIERRIKDYQSRLAKWSNPEYTGRCQEDKELLKFIDSLPEDYNNFGCSYRNALEKCFYQDDYLDEDLNWKSFRAEAAKDILCALIHKTDNFIGKDSAGYAIMIADELINKLKEKENK